jgi:RNA-dependent RNA polymerase
MKDSEKISGGSKESSKILEGNILMSRNPCTHPGDIRMLTAVGSHPEFDHLVNVVVFPSTGDRPLCNMMSGGDLDGDVYFVCWDQAILASLTP